MPNRIIKESVNESLSLSKCSLFAQDLFKRLITYADDYGRFNADPTIMLARLYPRELQYISQEDLIESLVELCGENKIVFYTAQPKKEIYGCFPNWSDHQRIRESKKRLPAPDDTSINDWYLRRFISIDMKAEIIERDGFKCRICGKFLTTCKDAKRFAKLSKGLFHIDHLVPCNQGGRATMENLQLTCPSCNLKRKRLFSFEEIVSFAFSPNVAESCGGFPLAHAAIQSNPIRIQSESNPNLNVREINDFFESVWKAYPKKEGKGNVSATQKKKLYEIGLDEMMRAIERYNKKLTAENTELRFIKQGSTFFNSGYVDYIDANYQEPKHNNKNANSSLDMDEIEQMIRNG